MQAFLSKKFVKYSLNFYNIAMLYLNKKFVTTQLMRKLGVWYAGIKIDSKFRISLGYNF